MAYRCGFTLQVLADTLQACGYHRTAGIAPPKRLICGWWPVERR
jgi:hypothetical protein